MRTKTKEMRVRWLSAQEVSLATNVKFVCMLSEWKEELLRLLLLIMIVY